MTASAGDGRLVRPGRTHQPPVLLERQPDPPVTVRPESPELGIELGGWGWSYRLGGSYLSERLAELAGVHPPPERQGFADRLALTAVGASLGPTSTIEIASAAASGDRQQQDIFFSAIGWILCDSAPAARDAIADVVVERWDGGALAAHLAVELDLVPPLGPAGLAICLGILFAAEEQTFRTIVAVPDVLGLEGLAGSQLLALLPRLGAAIGLTVAEAEAWRLLLAPLPPAEHLGIKAALARRGRRHRESVLATARLAVEGLPEASDQAQRVSIIALAPAGSLEALTRQIAQTPRVARLVATLGAKALCWLLASEQDVPHRLKYLRRDAQPEAATPGQTDFDETVMTEPTLSHVRHQLWEVVRRYARGDRARRYFQDLRQQLAGLAHDAREQERLKIRAPVVADAQAVLDHPDTLGGMSIGPLDAGNAYAFAIYITGEPVVTVAPHQIYGLLWYIATHLPQRARQTGASLSDVDALRLSFFNQIAAGRDHVAATNSVTLYCMNGRAQRLLDAFGDGAYVPYLRQQAQIAPQAVMANVGRIHLRRLEDAQTPQQCVETRRRAWSDTLEAAFEAYGPHDPTALVAQAQQAAFAKVLADMNSALTLEEEAEAEAQTPRHDSGTSEGSM